MKIIATLAIAALTATSAPDWRKESADALVQTQAAAALALDYNGSTRRRLSMWQEANSQAIGATATAYGNARVEVELAGDKVTKGQLEGLLLRAQSVLDTTSAMTDLMIVGFKGSDDDKVSLLINRTQALVYVLDARDRLASFSETK